MLQDVITSSEQLQIEEFSSPFDAQIYELCDPELFSERLQNSELDSNSNYCYDENSPYSFSQETINFTNTINTNATTTAISTTTTPTSPATITNNNPNLSLIFDSSEEFENEISASIDFSPSPPSSVPPFSVPSQQYQFDLSLLQTQIPETGFRDGFSQYPLMGQPLPAVYEDECLSSVPFCSFLNHAMGTNLQGNLGSGFSAENSGIFSGAMLLENEMQPQDLDFEGDNSGIFCPEPLPRIFNSEELQGLSNESQHLVSGGGSSTPSASEISTLENPTYKMGKISAEERKEKIHRYMKKRNERNFSKKIKYACRKTLADSRPRVRGRFAKNDEFGENPTTMTTTCINLEDYTHGHEDVSLIPSSNYNHFHVVVKEEDDITSDIFAHISGLNSFKCNNYPIQSWI